MNISLELKGETHFMKDTLFPLIQHNRHLSVDTLLYNSLSLINNEVIFDEQEDIIQLERIYVTSNQDTVWLKIKDVDYFFRIKLKGIEEIIFFEKVNLKKKNIVDMHLFWLRKYYVDDNIGVIGSYKNNYNQNNWYRLSISNKEYSYLSIYEYIKY
jgi:hypothetical protein